MKALFLALALGACLTAPAFATDGDKDGGGLRSIDGGGDVGGRSDGGNSGGGGMDGGGRAAPAGVDKVN